MAKLVKIEGGKWVGVNNEGAVVFRVESLDDLKIAQLPEARKKRVTKKKPRLRWKDGSYLKRQQVEEEEYQIRMGIA